MSDDIIFSNTAQDYLLRVLEAGAGQSVEHVPDVPPAGALQLLHQPHRQRPVHRVHVRDVVRPLHTLVLLGTAHYCHPTCSSTLSMTMPSLLLRTEYCDLLLAPVLAVSSPAPASRSRLGSSS